MTDGMAPEGLPEDLENAIDGVMERVDDLLVVLQARGYGCGTALFNIAKDELLEAIEAETHDG